MIVVDAGVLASALVDVSDQGQRMRDRLEGEELAAPAMLDLEVTAVIRKTVRAGRATDHQAALALLDLLCLPIERVPHQGLIRRVWELHRNVAPYDAAYVAVAEMLSATLLTFDGRLGRAPGPNCAIEVVPT